MFWDDLVRRWRREHNVMSHQLLVGAGGNVAVLPALRRRPRWILLLVLAVVLGAVLYATVARPAGQAGDTVTPIVTPAIR
jgi:hypothetical protein